MLIFGEAKDLNFSFYAGLGLIFLSVALQTYRIIRTGCRFTSSNGTA